MKIEAGTVWQHYKGNKFMILTLCRLESSSWDASKEGAIMVVYTPWPLGGANFARPIQEWMESVSFAGVKHTRFEPYADNEAHARSRAASE